MASQGQKRKFRGGTVGQEKLNKSRIKTDNCLCSPSVLYGSFHVFFYQHFLTDYCTTRLEYPIRLSSTARAASLPSLMAHTTRDCPLCISPVTKTLSTLVL